MVVMMVSLSNFYYKIDRKVIEKVYNKIYENDSYIVYKKDTIIIRNKNSEDIHILDNVNIDESKLKDKHVMIFNVSFSDTLVIVDKDVKERLEKIAVINGYSIEYKVEDAIKKFGLSFNKIDEYKQYVLEQLNNAIYEWTLYEHTKNKLYITHDDIGKMLDETKKKISKSIFDVVLRVWRENKYNKISRISIIYANEKTNKKNVDTIQRYRFDGKKIVLNEKNYGKSVIKIRNNFGEIYAFLIENCNISDIREIIISTPIRITLQDGKNFIHLKSDPETKTIHIQIKYGQTILTNDLKFNRKAEYRSALSKILNKLRRAIIPAYIGYAYKVYTTKVDETTIERISKILNRYSPSQKPIKITDDISVVKKGKETIIRILGVDLPIDNRARLNIKQLNEEISNIRLNEGKYLIHVLSAKKELSKLIRHAKDDKKVKQLMDKLILLSKLGG